MRLPLRFELSESVRSKRNRRKPSGGFVLKDPTSRRVFRISETGSGEHKSSPPSFVRAVLYLRSARIKRERRSGRAPCQRFAVKSMKPREKKKSSSKKASSMSA